MKSAQFLLIPFSFLLALPAWAKFSYEQFPAVPKKGVYTDSIIGSPVTFVPFLATDTISNELAGQFYLPLLAIDPGTWELMPALATGVKVSKDKKEYAFELNPKARWSDQTPVTSDDIEFTFQKIMDPKTNAAVVRGALEGFTFRKIDPARFVFRIENPRYNSLLQIGDFVPVQKKQFQNEADINTSKEGMKPVGNSAYLLKSHSRDQMITLERNKTWWGVDLPWFRPTANFDTVVYRIIPDGALRYEKLIQGQLDSAPLNSEQYVNQVKGVDRDKFGTSPDSGKKVWADAFRTSRPLSWAGIAMNLAHPLLASKKTREALALLVDYDEVILKGFMGTASRCVSPFGTSSKLVSKELKDPARWRKFDPKTARKLLLEDGFVQEPGNPFFVKTVNGKKIPARFTFRFAGALPAQSRTAQILKESFRKNGVDLELRALEGSALFQDLERKEFDLALMGWSGGDVRPDPKQLWHSSSSKGGSNFTGYANPKVDALIEKANLEFNHPKREAILREIGDLLNQDLPYVFLFERDFVLAAIHSRIKSPRWIQPYGTYLAKELFYE